MRKKRYIFVIVFILSLFFNNCVFAENTVYTDGPFNYIIENNGDITITYYFGVDEEVKVPMAIGEHLVTSIGEGAFIDADVKSVSLPNTITSISSSAFYDVNAVAFKYFDKNDAYVEMSSPIIYQDIVNEKEQQKNTDNNNADKQIDGSSSEEVNFEDNSVSNLDADLDIFNEEVEYDSNKNIEQNSNESIISNSQEIITTNSTISINVTACIVCAVAIVGLCLLLIKRKKK